MPYDPENIPMRELERLTGVPRATILFYIKEGLLPRPYKTARNMSYYDHRFVEGLVLIRDLRERHRLTLRQIKQILMRENEGPDLGLLIEVRDRIFHRIAAKPDQPPVTRAQIIAATGIEAESLERMERMQLLFPLAQPGIDCGERRYHQDSILMARLFKFIVALGIPLELLTAAATNMLSLAQLETDALLKHVIKPMSANEESTETIWAATSLGIDLAQSFVALVHLHNLFRLITRPDWPPQIAAKALTHLQGAVDGSSGSAAI